MGWIYCKNNILLAIIPTLFLHSENIFFHHDLIQVDENLVMKILVHGFLFLFLYMWRGKKSSVWIKSQFLLDSNIRTVICPSYGQLMRQDLKSRDD